MFCFNNVSPLLSLENCRKSSKYLLFNSVPVILNLIFFVLWSFICMFFVKRFFLFLNLDIIDPYRLVYLFFIYFIDFFLFLRYKLFQVFINILWNWQFHRKFIVCYQNLLWLFFKKLLMLQRSFWNPFWTHKYRGLPNLRTVCPTKLNFCIWSYQFEICILLNL